MLVRKEMCFEENKNGKRKCRKHKAQQSAGLY
jgi:hypothetical protein